MLTDTEMPAMTPGQERYDPQIAELRAEMAATRELATTLADAIHEMGKAVAEFRETAVLANGTALKAHERIDELDGQTPARALLDTIESRLSFLVARAKTAEARSSVIEPQPAVRVRTNHAWTAKNGWVLSETTVEWCGPAGGIDPEGLLALSTDAFNAGVREARLRNASPAGEDGPA